MTTGKGLDPSQIEFWLQQIRTAANSWQARADSVDAWDVEPGSALAGDDRKTAPLQTSHLAQGGLLAAVDNLQALMALTVEHRTLHAFAPATLARAVAECASATVWLLEPRSRDERVLRTLRLNAKDLKDSNRAHLQVGQSQVPPLAERLLDVQRLAAAAGVDEKASIAAPTSTDMVTAADQYLQRKGPGISLLSVWQLTSGYAHGRRWAALAFSEREERDTGHPDITNLRFSFNYERLLAVTTPAFEATRAALDLYDRRAESLYPTSQG